MLSPGGSGRLPTDQTKRDSVCIRNGPVGRPIADGTCSTILVTLDFAEDANFFTGAGARAKFRKRYAAPISASDGSEFHT